MANSSQKKRSTPSINPQPPPVNREPPTASGFRGLVGQTRALHLVQQALRAGRIAHAYLFTGPEGIGKRAAAIALAQALNCHQDDAIDDGCGACQSCRKVVRGLHPDVQVIEPAGTTMKIEQIRALQAEAALGRYEGKRKVFILDGADKMMEQAANALLKTLEEPPGWTVLVLLSTTPSALPPTIVSRCQVVIFSPIPPETLEAYLVGKGIEQAQARLIVSFSGGSIGRALGPEMPSLAASRDLLLNEMDQGLREGPMGLIDFAEKHAKDREGLQRKLELLSAWLRDLMVLKVSRRRDWLINQDRGEEVARWAEQIPLAAILDGLRAVHRVMDGLARNANARLSLEHLLLRLRAAVAPSLSRVSA